MEKNINLIVSADENNLRLDVFVNKREKLISRTRIKNLILKEKLKLNNVVVNTPSKKISTGDKIDLQIPEPKEASLKPYDFKLKNCFYLSTKNNLNEAAKNLYSCLRKIKNKGYKSIAVEKISNKGLGKAINDRLLKASRY